MSFTDSSGRHLHGIEPMVSGPENGAQTHFARTTREAVVHISG
jgi:hypothetical protein